MQQSIGASGKGGDERAYRLDLSNGLQSIADIDGLAAES